MAKSYAFRFNAQKAEFKDGFVSVLYGSNCTIATEAKEMPYADALAYLAEFSAALPAPHVAFIAMQYRNDRKPNGFDKTAKRIDKKV